MAIKKHHDPKRVPAVAKDKPFSPRSGTFKVLNSKGFEQTVHVKNQNRKAYHRVSKNLYARSIQAERRGAHIPPRAPKPSPYPDWLDTKDRRAFNKSKLNHTSHNSRFRALVYTVARERGLTYMEAVPYARAFILDEERRRKQKGPGKRKYKIGTGPS
jgi:hypothetical protein